MTARKATGDKALAALPAKSSTDYEIGYGKPPKETRFRKGQSGNPKGRPKGAKNKEHGPLDERLKEIILEEAYRTISVRDGQREVNVPMAQAVIRSLAVNAVKGQQRAQRLFTELLSSTERDHRRQHEEWLDVATTYKVEWERELDRRQALGITAPDPIPHPDHVHINFRTGAVSIRGPITKQEKAQHDEWRARREDLEEELRELNEMLADPDQDIDRDILIQEIAEAEHVLEILAKVLPQ